LKISIKELLRRGGRFPATIYSLDPALYQVTVWIDDVEQVLVESDGRALRRHSLTAMREALQTLPLEKLTLKQTSAYDEMIGQPRREGDNTLELPLSMDIYPPPVKH
jgi:hypothetical protein